MTEPSPSSNNETATNDKGESRTTVLSPGIVESRNQTNRTQISTEIQDFLSGTTTTDGNGGILASEYRTFFTIWMFITRLPSPSWVDLHPGYLMRGMVYFPIAGSVLGCMYAIVFDFVNVSLDLPPSIAASFMVGMGLYMTGCFHEDGLADSADGLGGGWSKSQVLKIMTDSRVGTFGCAALGMFLLIKVQLLGSVLGVSHWQLWNCSGGGPAIIVSQTVARLSAPYLIRTRDYIAEVGPKSPFYVFMVEAKYLVSWGRLAIATSFSLALACVMYGPIVSTALITVVLVVAHLMGNKGDYLLGGVMGDFLGSTICVCEIAALTFISAKNGIIATCLSIRDELLFDSEEEGFFLLSNVYKNSSIRAVFHFVLLSLALKGWLTFVGPPDMYDREDNKEDKDTECNDNKEKEN